MTERKKLSISDLDPDSEHSLQLINIVTVQQRILMSRLNSVPDPYDFLYGSGSSDPYPDVTDPAADAFHLSAIVKEHNFLYTTLPFTLLCSYRHGPPRVDKNAQAN